MYFNVHATKDSMASPYRTPTDRISTAESPPNNIPNVVEAAPSSTPSSSSVVIPVEVSDGPSQTIEGCRCRHSHCSKMYCECFTAGRYCTELCQCIGCENCATNEASLSRIRMGIRRRNPNAFTAKINKTSGIRKHSRGCRCTRSKCLKRYCECFREGMSCTEDCECKECHNGRDATSVLPSIGASDSFLRDDGFLNALTEFLGS